MMSNNNLPSSIVEGRVYFDTAEKKIYIDTAEDRVSLYPNSPQGFGIAGQFLESQGTGNAPVWTTLDNFGGSGNNHANGLVPDPGGTAGYAKYLCEDGNWKPITVTGEGNAITSLTTNENGITFTKGTIFLHSLVPYENTLTWGTSIKIATITSDTSQDINVTLPAKPKTYLYANGANTQEKNSHDAVGTNDGNVYLRVYDDNTASNEIQLHAGSNMAITSDAYGTITFNATNTTYSVVATGGLNIDSNNALSIASPSNQNIANQVLGWDEINHNPIWTTVNVSNNNNSSYVLPTADENVLGGIKTHYNNNTNNGQNYPVELDSNDRAYVNVPWSDTDTHYATHLYVNGSSGENSNSAVSSGNIYLRLYDNSTNRENIQLHAGSNVTITSDAYGTITFNATDTTYSTFGASGNSHSSGLVPDPGSTSGTSKFLCENGTWAIPNLALTQVVTSSEISSQDNLNSDLKVPTMKAVVAYINSLVATGNGGSY